ncbi:MAG TPA: tagaturonate reductase [Rhodothermales bacterium]|nr:tagaturonate reductase [Rhodothermales bacterium]
MLPPLNISTLNGAEAARSAMPERVLQFGTGAFLRGFAEYFVEQANRVGSLNGRVVMVGSTGSGRTRQLNNQDGLYTLYVRGREDGQIVDQAQVLTAVSRALASLDQWAEVLACARQPELALVISNTTEVGIMLDEDDQIDLDPPRSFPGKLTAALYERARMFDFDPAKGLIILPCELLENNGDKLRQIVQTLAARWDLGSDFRQWLDEANQFCNTLVDRIVPGTPDEVETLYQQLGYRDDLLTVAEPYRLWAIEGNATLEACLPLAGVDPGIIIAEDITPFRERKVRILNGTHTIMVSAALLCGLATVREAVEDARVGRFIRQVMLEEIVPSLDIAPEMARAFAEEVLERFANPFICHDLLDITFQQTTKMRVRVVPSLLGYVEKENAVPPAIAFGFACFLLFQHPDVGPPAAERPTDDAASDWRDRWVDVDRGDATQIRLFVATVCADEALWGARLDALPGFAEAVADLLIRIARDGVVMVLETHASNPESKIQNQK